MKWIGIILCFCLIVMPTFGSIIMVPDEQPNIQAGIDAAFNNDTVLISDGIYTGTGNTNLQFFGKAIRVMSEHGPDVCIIDGEGTEQGFRFDHGESKFSVLSGVTIRNCISDRGGAIFCANASPSISQCIIENNIAQYGGGIYSELQAPFISFSTIRDNTASDAGGGIYCSRIATMQISTNLITENTAGTSSIAGIGGGIYLEQITESVSFFNNTIDNNHAQGSPGNPGMGGGIAAHHINSTTIQNCILSNNTAEQGAGLHMSDCTAKSLVYSDIFNNALDGISPDVTCIDTAPLFVSGILGNYYLSHIDADQAIDSPCVNAGQPDSSTMCFSYTGSNICLNQTTTRTDHVADLGLSDIGFHYLPFESQPFTPTPLPTPTSSPTSIPTSGAAQFWGVHYTAWEPGLLPESSCWKPLHDGISEAIESAEICSEHPASGSCALCCDFHLMGQPSQNASGEVMVDLLYCPPVCDLSSCIDAPIDLSGTDVSVTVHCPTGLGGAPDAENFLQLFAKDIHGEYHLGVAVNARQGGIYQLHLNDKNRSSADLTRIRYLGVKIGANANWAGEVRGSLTIDDIDWMASDEDACHPKYGFETTACTGFNEMLEANIGAVSLVVTWYMETACSNEIQDIPAMRPSDVELIETINRMPTGTKTMLKPHVDVLSECPTPCTTSDLWRGHICPADVELWFQSYSDFILHYAQLAEQNSVDMLCIGTELQSMTNLANIPRWAVLTQQIREVYSGYLTYAANWTEYRFIEHSFWFPLDYAGINAFFPLSASIDPPMNEIRLAWMSNKQKIESWHSDIQKPVLFTEIGYGSHDYAAAEPSEVCFPDCPHNPNCDLQRRCAEAALLEFSNYPWFCGLFWWNWNPMGDFGGCCDTSHSPQHKPVMGVFSDYFPTFTPTPDATSTPTPSPTPSCFHHGDVTLDGSVTAGDAQLSFWIAMGLYTPTHQEFCAADCTGDDSVTAGDAQLVFYRAMSLGSCVDPLE